MSGKFLRTAYIDDTLVFYANTHDPSDGKAADADAPPTYRVYEESTNTPILTGSMTLLDGGNTTGLYSASITLSAANGFEVGKQYGLFQAAAVNAVNGTKTDTFAVRARPALQTDLPANFSTLTIAAGAVDANTISIQVAAAQAIAQEVFRRNVTLDEAAAPIFSLASAILATTSRIGDNGAGGLVVYRTDGTTVKFTRAITVDAALNPVRELGVGS